MTARAGIRIFHDHVVDKLGGPQRLTQLIELEKVVCRSEPFASLGQHTHLTCRWVWTTSRGRVNHSDRVIDPFAVRALRSGVASRRPRSGCFPTSWRSTPFRCWLADRVSSPAVPLLAMRGLAPLILIRYRTGRLPP